jgi:hypothetical protein
MSTMPIPPYIVQALNKIQESDPDLATALITVISYSHIMSNDDILGFCCRCRNRRMHRKGLMGEMNCSNPYLQAISDYLMAVHTGTIKGPGGVRA